MQHTHTSTTRATVGPGYSTNNTREQLLPHPVWKEYTVRLPGSHCPDQSQNAVLISLITSVETAHSAKPEPIPAFPLNHHVLITLGSKTCC